MTCCNKCGRPRGEHSREALTSPNPQGWRWSENACPVGDGPFHPEQTFESDSESIERLRQQYVADLHRAHRTCEAIANLLSGEVPWTDAAKMKAAEYATYFEAECKKLSE